MSQRVVTSSSADIQVKVLQAPITWAHAWRSFADVLLVNGSLDIVPGRNPLIRRCAQIVDQDIEEVRRSCSIHQRGAHLLQRYGLVQLLCSAPPVPLCCMLYTSNTVVTFVDNFRLSFPQVWHQRLAVIRRTEEPISLTGAAQG